MRHLLFALAIAAGCNPEQPSPQYAYETSPQQEQPQPQTYAQSYGPQHLGVALEPMTPELRAYFGAPPDRGVLVTRVQPGSAADQAGIVVGDVIVSAGNFSIQRKEDLRNVIASRTDNTLDIQAIRRGVRTTMRAQLGNQVSEAEPDPTL